MTPELLAKQLDGREYGSEIGRGEEQSAKTAGLVIVFGYSDDNVEFRGVIHDEVGLYGAGDVFVNTTGVLPSHEDCECEFCGFKQAKAKAKKIRAVWDRGGYSWIYETDIPHATFEILDDGEKYCRGIVFKLEDLK